MGSNNLLTSMIQDAILKLCTQNVQFDASLEIDGIICITPGEQAKEIVVKMHRTIMKPASQVETFPVSNSPVIAQSSLSSQRNLRASNIDPSKFGAHVAANISFDEMPKQDPYTEDSSGAYYAEEPQQQYESTPTKLQRKRKAGAPSSVTTEEKYIKVEPGESDIFVEEPTAIAPRDTTDDYTDTGQGVCDYGSEIGHTSTAKAALYTPSCRSKHRQQDMFIEDSTVFICNLCGIEYPSKACLEYHTMVVHNKFCDICQRRLDNEDNQMEHGLLHKGLKPFSCDLCYKGFNTPRGVAFHQTKDLQCVLCKKLVQFSNKNKHMKLHLTHL